MVVFSASECEAFLRYVLPAAYLPPKAGPGTAAKTVSVQYKMNEWLFLQVYCRKQYRKMMWK